MNKKRVVWLWAVLLAVLSLAGCAPVEEEPLAGASISGALTREEAGRELPFTIEIAEEGDPLGISFRGMLTEGNLSLQLIGPEPGDAVYTDWAFTEPGPFAMTTNFSPPPGTYRLGLVWDGPVQLAQYELQWRPHLIEPVQMRPIALLSGLGMVLVALGFVVYAATRRLGWSYLALGALAWIVTVALKFAWAIPVNTPVYEGLQGLLPETPADLIFYLYVGALTGAFEVALTWLVLRYTRLGQVGWGRALAFGIGFGAVEALVLGALSLINVSAALMTPEVLPVAALEQLAQLNNPLFGLAPITERFFTVLIHIFCNVLLFYGARQRRSRWFWLSFAFKSGIDAVAAFAQLWGVDTLGRIWIIEAVVILWGLLAWLGTRWVASRYPPSTD
jgi:uncharacterized membrane protein YhfC